MQDKLWRIQHQIAQTGDGQELHVRCELGAQHEELLTHAALLVPPPSHRMRETDETPVQARPWSDHLSAIPNESITHMREESNSRGPHIQGSRSTQAYGNPRTRMSKCAL